MKQISLKDTIYKINSQIENIQDCWQDDVSKLYLEALNHYYSELIKMDKSIEIGTLKMQKVQLLCDSINDSDSCKTYGQKVLRLK